MTVAAAIAKVRALWPQVTEAAAPDTWLAEYYADALEVAGDAYFPETAARLRAVAHLLAHAAYRLDPMGVFSSGVNPGTVSAVTTGRRSVTYGGKSPADYALTLSDAALATTRPGQMYLSIRGRQLGSLPTVITCL